MDCIYCGGATGDEYDEHEACVERSMERSLLDAAAEANERIRSCHEVVACPKCGAVVGERCFHVVKGRGATVKHPHAERWTLVQPAR